MRFCTAAQLKAEMIVAGDEMKHEGGRSVP